MKTFNLFDKILSSLCAVGFILWLGGSIIRLVIGFDIFIPGTAILKGYSNELSLHLAQLYAITAPYVDISFIIVFLVTLYLLFKFSSQLKQNGWLFMCAILIILIAIPNGYLFYYDYNLVIAAAKDGITFNSPEIQEYFLHRFTKLNYLDPLVLLSGITIPILVVFRPLNNKIRNKNTTLNQNDSK